MNHVVGCYGRVRVTRNTKNGAEYQEQGLHIRCMTLLSTPTSGLFTSPIESMDSHFVGERTATAATPSLFSHFGFYFA